MARPKRAEYDLMPAAGIAERSYNVRSVELGRMQFEPANSEIDVADRSGIARLRRLPKIDSGHEDTIGRQRFIDAGITIPVAVVPRATMHVDDGREWSGPLGLVDPNQPGLAGQLLILDISYVYFVFSVGVHAGNLQREGVALQALENFSLLAMTPRLL